MRYIDVRVRIPITKMGQLVEQLPDWAAMVGYDKLAGQEPQQKRSYNSKTSNGSTSQKVLKVLKRSGPLAQADIASKSGLNTKAVSNAVYRLANNRVIKRLADGTYGVSK